MGKTLSINLTYLLAVLPIILAVFNISVNENLIVNSKDINPSQACEENYHIRTIVIDAGHGGKDGGCTGATNSIEKHLALDIALKLGKTIKRHYPELKIIYTRNRDVFVPLHHRAEIANKNKADLFISIHCNNIVNAAHIHGSETYVMGLHRADDNLKVAKRENEAILMEENYHQNYDGYDPYSAEGHIILSYVQNAYLEQSILFADKVEKHIHSKTGRKSRGVKQAGFLVLRNTTMPSVLIETGYLSNTSDETYLLSNHGKSQMANAIFHAFADYKYEMESSSAVPQLARQANNKRFTAKSPSKSAQPVTVAPRQTIQQPKTSTASASTENLKITRTSRIIPITQNTHSTTTTPSRIVQSTSPTSSAISPIAKPIFMVQLASADRLLNTQQGKWNYVPHSIEVKQESGLYKYLAIGFSDFHNAVNGQKRLRQLGFKDAFVVAYQNGKRINLSKAKTLARLN